MSLKQGDTPSEIWFDYGIDGVLWFLQKCLKGITIYSLKVHGPSKEGEPRPLPPIETKYIVL